MIERIISLSIRHRALVILAGFLLAGWGTYAVYHTPVDAIPDLSENQVVVFTDWLGHSPHEIEQQITYPLSLNLQGLAGVRVVRSASNFNFSMINVIFEDAVDFSSARREVSERLARAGSYLPAGVSAQLSPDAVATGQIFWYTLEGTGQDLGKLRSIQDWYVRPQLASVPGVAEVAGVGGFPIEFHVDLDPHRLQARGVSLKEAVAAVENANGAVGGHVIEEANAEYIVRAANWLGQGTDNLEEFDTERTIRDLEKAVVPLSGGKSVQIGDLGTVSLGPGFRRGLLEKDGNEVVGGVVVMRFGENPLEVTRRIKQKIQELSVGLPGDVRIVPFYDRAPLIEGAIHTVTATVLEAILTATVCVVLVLLHLRTSFIIAVTLPLAALTSFAIMWALRRLGIADIQTNIMSLAGIAISVGVLVDAAVVMAENVMHNLHNHFGDRKVSGDIRHLVLPACLTVGRPIFFSVLIMLLSFLPVFALDGIEGKMFHPLAFTKTFALLAVAVLAITLVPALCTVFIKGRLRCEKDNWLVRGVVEVYRPVLAHFLSRPALLVWLVSATFVVGLTPLGIRWIFLAVLFVSLVVNALVTRTWLTRLAGPGALVLIALLADQHLEPLAREFITPLDEGMVMDMPITAPRVSIAQAANDLKARNMVFCRFPEVDMVIGKAGRAETPTDPAPLDMIESMVNFRPLEFWPRRKLRPIDARQQSAEVLDSLVSSGILSAPPDGAARAGLLESTVAATLPLFDAQIREFVYQRNQEFARDVGRQLVHLAVESLTDRLAQNGKLERSLRAGDIALMSAQVPAPLTERLAMAPTYDDVAWLARQAVQHLVQGGLVLPAVDLLSEQPGSIRRIANGIQTALGWTPLTLLTRLHEGVLNRHRKLWLAHLHTLNRELISRAAGVYTRLALEALLEQGTVLNPAIPPILRGLKELRNEPPVTHGHHGQHHHESAAGTPVVALPPALHSVQARLTEQMSRSLILWRVERTELAGFGGELDQAMQMPGWTNVWTMPIQNRVDMLATGVNTAVGIRVLGPRLVDVVRVSNEIAQVVKPLRGAADVVADPVHGKSYLDIRVDRDRAARQGVTVGDVNELIETALGGKVAATVMAGRERFPVRVRFGRAWRDSEEDVGNLPVMIQTPAGAAAPADYIALDQVAHVRILDGPASIHTENGTVRNYVSLNVRDRDAADFVEEAKQVVAQQVVLPPGVFIEWTGRFEHEAHAQNTLFIIVPLVVSLIFLILYFTYHDLADALLMLLAVPGAIAGGILFQRLFGFKFSVTVMVGYLACFGMATSTGIIMLVYLREAVDKAGGLARISLDGLRQAVLDGAVHRLRPKLLTEATVVIGLAPLLWATGTGAEVIKPMTAPVLGGILIADEIIDLLLPVLFFRVRRRRWERLRLFGINNEVNAAFEMDATP